MNLRILLDPQGGEGGTDTDPTPTPKAPARGPDLSKAAEGLVAKHGDPTAALLVLLGENYAKRDEIRQLREKLPADGAVILTGDDAKAWADYRSLGKVEDVRKVVKEFPTLAARVKDSERTEELRQIAEIAGFRPSVLKTLAGDLAFEVKEDKGKDGKPSRVVTVKDGDAEAVPIDQYAEAKWADFLPSLRAEAAPPARLGTPNPRPAPRPAEAPTEDRSSPEEHLLRSNRYQPI